MAVSEDYISRENKAPVPASIFRAYDIRGIVGEQLSDNVIRQIGQAIGSEALSKGINTLLLGFDGRLSSPQLSKALIDGLRSTGCNVVSLGMIPTPLLYFATHTTEFSSGVILTASHNPSNYNGIKIVFNRTCLADNELQDIRNRIEEDNLIVGEGNFSEIDIKPDYIKNVSSRINLKTPLKIVLDCGNAVPGEIAPLVFESIGCDVSCLFCDVDGNFPNHHPDPTVPENLEILAQEVIKQKADLGIALDGDGDRVGLVDNRGEIIDANRILMLLVKQIAPLYPGSPIVFDVKCSSKLADLITECGSVPIMHRSGHSFMKQKMQETGAPVGGEYAAHIFIQDRWFGFDDGMYAGARVLEILSTLEHSASKEFASLTTNISTPEIKVPVDEERKFELMQQILDSASFPGARMITLDGLRVEYEDGWGLIRASNTSPALLLRFEADTDQRLEDIKAAFKALIHSADKSLDVNF
ncbi:MAG: phosphomannomutase/phosphoglucomutase [SAR86 cluster bacterium]|uniref:phosphomannomutase n=1 Tax=SAR86 cluster bacterium TaxID=2030880 RepID=A0A2A5B136_9GAMM|nr:MAG: phosphomannomutase/phosphoglucomutase [SAR86 cluster bacterium]